MTEIESNFVHANGLRLHYREAGEGRVLLLLHGWPTHSGLYRNIIPALAQHRRVLALDLPGFGRSDKPTDVRYGFSFFDNTLNAFLEAVGAGDEQIGLVVHDLGGPIGVHWASRNLDRLSEIAVLNSLVFPELHWAVKAFVASLMLPGLRRIVASPFGVKSTMKFGVFDASRITHEVAAMYSEVYQSRDACTALRKAGTELSPKGFARLSHALEGVAKRKIPAALIYGERDRVLPDVARTMSRLQAQWPHASSTSFANAGHFLQEDVPDELTKALVAFVSTAR